MLDNDISVDMNWKPARDKEKYGVGEWREDGREWRELYKWKEVKVERDGWWWKSKGGREIKKNDVILSTIILRD